MGKTSVKLRPSLFGAVPAWWNGRHKRLKIARRKPCQFESDSGHQGSPMLRRLAALILTLSVLLGAHGEGRAEPALWVVRDTDSTVYLFGTIHVLPADFAWRDARIDAAMAASDELWLEADIDNILASVFSTLRYAINYGIPLDKRLSKDDAQRLRRAERRLGMPKGGLNQLRPWLVSMMIDMGGVGDDMAPGADDDLLSEAKAASKRVRFLETLNEQFPWGQFPEGCSALILQVRR